MNLTAKHIPTIYILAHLFIMKKRHDKKTRQCGTNTRKLLCGEAESCNQQETEAEQVICNRNVRGIRGSTARSLRNENMPKNSRARNFCLQSENPNGFLASILSPGEAMPILMLQLSSPVLAHCWVFWKSQSIASAFSLTGPIFM